MKEKALYSSYLNGFKCKYYITQTNKTFSNGEDCISSYGIKIDLFSLEDCLKDSAVLQHVGINENDVKEYIRNLYNGQVLPCSLKAMSTNAV